MQVLVKFRENLTLLKMYFNRAITYVSLVNTGMILTLFLDKINQLSSIHIDIGRWGFIIYIVALVGAIFVGYLDVKFGFYKAENNLNTSQIPQTTEILARLKSIENKIDEGKKNG